MSRIYLNFKNKKYIYMKINFKKLNQQATIPSRSKEGDAGYDMTATDIEIKDNMIVYKYSYDLSKEVNVE